MSLTQKNTLKRIVRTRTLFPKSFIIWCGDTANSETPLIFIDKNVKINAQVYQDDIIPKSVIPWCRKNPNMIFQQDWAPAHGSKSTMELIRREFPLLFTNEDWPSNTSDLNPLDFSVWSHLEEKLRFKKITNLDYFKFGITYWMGRSWWHIPAGHHQFGDPTFKGLCQSKGS